jgi:hypothetical protein
MALPLMLELVNSRGEPKASDNLFVCLAGVLMGVVLTLAGAAMTLLSKAMIGQISQVEQAQWRRCQRDRFSVCN